MGCCSATWFLICLSFTSVYVFMIVYGKTHGGLDNDTADSLVAAGSVCLAWSMFYLVTAFLLLVSGQGLNTYARYMSLRTTESGWFVTTVLIVTAVGFVTSLVIIPVGATKGIQALWAAGLANLLYSVFTGVLMIAASCCCMVLTHGY